MSPDAARRIDEVLAQLSLADRTNLAARTILVNDLHSLDCLLDLVGLISILARRLPVAEQLALRWELANAIEEIGEVPWN